MLAPSWWVSSTGTQKDTRSTFSVTGSSVYVKCTLSGMMFSQMTSAQRPSSILRVMTKRMPMSVSS